ncbi:gliding motility-associated-like protein [Flavobacterium sp. PL11]|uniref:T9SS type B sorting domain-containing protein n=1 Tax=Flavobacterium sp. PL11 TaxID=3071717 RepID=UPI002E03840E|nr:gliding motility-associated-like protein [Flavobacterium sp. PL11]
MKKILLFLFAFVSLSGLAQLSKTHFIPPLTTSSANGVRPEDHYIYISSPSLTSINFKIIEIGGVTINRTVNKNIPYRYSIGSGDNTPLFVPSNSTGIVSNKGYIIEAEGLVFASIRTNSGNGNQAGGLVAKGNSALGKRFRAGAMLNTSNITTLLNFFTVLATENNTTVTISNILPGTVLANGSVFDGSETITLNKNQSYILAINGSPSFNMIAALIESDKNVVVNSGSFGGTNDPTDISALGNDPGRDLGFDQIVGADKIGSEYIFIKGLADRKKELERILIIADEDNTEIFINGSITPIEIIQAGEKYIADGNAFTNGSLYIKTSKKVFAYQSIGGSNSSANQNLFFVPPLNCSTPKVVDNIPYIDKIGSKTFTGTINIVTKIGANVSITGPTISVTNPLINPVPILGTNYEYYSISGLSGNVSINSEAEVYVSYLGNSGVATYGGYYSGFDLKPEILSESNLSITGNCIPNITLKTSFDIDYSFQWIFNGSDIPDAISDSYTPTRSGYYQVRRSILSCGSSTLSDKIPVSVCPPDTDNDGTNNNIDIDLDNDGILNTTESTSNFINQSDINSGSNFTANTAGDGPLLGKIESGFTSIVPAGIAKSNTYTMTFNSPSSISFEYIGSNTATQTTADTELLNNEGDFILRVDPSQTLTLTDPNGQLEVDTNYDGVFESDVKEFSSFEIRFRLKGTTPLLAGTGTFKIESFLAKKIEFVHFNLSDINSNKATFVIKERITRDSDGDGITDDLDTDSDNDSIPDLIEAQPNNSVAISNIDTNKDGLDNAFEPGFTPFDNDNDGIPDYLDLDSDNDGILDSDETANDLDADGIKNYRDLDSDDDLCLDVAEAGFIDGDTDGRYGNSPVSVNANGLVNGASYNSPNLNYLIAAPIEILTQPQATATCELENTFITLTDNGGNTYQWQLSTDGINWSDLVNNVTYSGVQTKTLELKGITTTMNNYQYRVALNKIGNSCGLISDPTILTVYPKPLINSPIVLTQCDDDTNGLTTFNITQKNSFISVDYLVNTFTYFENSMDAINGFGASKIVNPIAYVNTVPFNQTIFVRVENGNGCTTVGSIELKISTTTIPPTFTQPFTVCDDLTANPNSDYDGISVFDFHQVTNRIKSLYFTGSNPYTITYYRNESDALSEINALNQTVPSDPFDPTSIYNYRNIGYPNTQKIWIRVDSEIDNACFGLGPYITLTVEKTPIANPVIIPNQCDDNQDGIFTFNTSTLETTLRGTNQPYAVTTRYVDAFNNPLKDENGVLIDSPFPASFTTRSQVIKAIITNNTTLQCFDETLITFTVDKLPKALNIPTALTTICDDEVDPLLQDGKYAFDTSTFEATILAGQTGMTVKYFAANGDLLPSPLPNPFITNTQNITAVVENSINPSCKATIIIPFIVNPLPAINLNINGDDNELVCSNLPTFFVTLNAGVTDTSKISDYKYEWYKDNAVLLGEINPTLNINLEGIYTVQVTTLTGCFRIRTIKVTASDIATISTIDIEDLTDINKVIINVTGTGLYEYSLDDPDGPFQSSNIFDNVQGGIYDVYINDVNGCGIVKQRISVLGIPKFFTPNNDGLNDFWKVKGINSNFNSKSIIYIFDRYGKLLKQLNATGLGWDGTFKGLPLPSDDYWYSIMLEDGREAKGNFSLKR